MPIKSSRLSKSQQQKYVAYLQQLRARGADIEIPPPWLEDARVLEIVLRCDGSTRVFESAHGGVYYAVYLRLIARQSYIILCDCRLETDWDDEILMGSYQRMDSFYWLGPHQYPAKEVLNDRIENRLQFSHRGQLAEGVILFSGLRPIPEHYRYGMSAPFKLTFLDQFDETISVESELFVSRDVRHRGAGARSSGADNETVERPLVRRSTLFDGDDGSSERPPDWALEALIPNSPRKDGWNAEAEARKESDPEKSQQGSLK